MPKRRVARAEAFAVPAVRSCREPVASAAVPDVPGGRDR